MGAAGVEVVVVVVCIKVGTHFLKILKHIGFLLMDKKKMDPHTGLLSGKTG